MNPDSEAASYDGASIRTGISRQSSLMLPESDQVVCIKNDDSINIEFVYYTVMLKKFAPNLSKEKDKVKVIPWIRKLYAAEYATNFFKIKRNRYLFNMILSILNDEMYGVFKSIPPAGPLKSPESFTIPSIPLATWEVDTMWEEMLKDEDDTAPICSMHVKCPEKDDDDEEILYTSNISVDEFNAKREKIQTDKNKKAIFSSLLDWEFQYLLHISRPYAALMTTIQDKTRVAKWLQKLCGIRMDMTCTKMKGVRNDYMMALLGYLYDLRLTGPFEHPPPDGPLVNLEKAMDKLKDSYPLTVPTQNDVNEFLTDQPTPAEGGAFCYIAISGDLQATNLIKSKPVHTKDCSK
ncbi:uncharacterized protein LOC112694654 [Sipha flava]|jgi:hypothetical protein|uniref:Uncharacterized protein LOC112694654 n=1 Tax=Sipha flava TaxID=143950 RepID=A0A8B8GUH7_9HEMI|nr:uncharacterized protein LOC112694654 [Sipha flava]